MSDDERDFVAAWASEIYSDINATGPGGHGDVIAFKTPEARDAAMARLSQMDPRWAVEANQACAGELRPHKRPDEAGLYQTLRRLMTSREAALVLLREIDRVCDDHHPELNAVVDKVRAFLAALETP